MCFKFYKDIESMEKGCNSKRYMIYNSLRFNFSRKVLPNSYAKERTNSATPIYRKKGLVEIQQIYPET